MFAHLKELEIKDKTVEYPIVQLRGCPKLIVKPATESNPPYFNQVLRRSSKIIRKVARNKNIPVTTDDLAQNREEDRRLFPKYVVCGWSGVTDSKGSSVPFSIENCTEFLKVLPDWIFDELGIFCRNNSNFAPEELDQDEMEDLAQD